MNRTPPAVLVAVAIGGALGGLLRHFVDVLVISEGFPWATFLINVTGSTLLAMLPGVRFVQRSQLLPPALGAGVLGGFTTLSTFSVQTHDLLTGGRTLLAAGYLVASVASCLIGIHIARQLTKRAQSQHTRMVPPAEGGE